MPTVKPTAVSANTQLLTWMNKFNDLLSYSSLWDGGQLAKLTDDAGLVFPLASGGNLNNLKGSSTKNYVPANAVNSPLAVAGVVDVDAVDANNATQIFTTLGTGAVRKFSRNLVSGSWTAWTEYASTSLASTSNAGLMSPTDKTNINTLLTGQLYKMTENDGSLQNISDSTPLASFKIPGRFKISGTHPDNPNPAYNGILVVDYSLNGSFVYQWISSISSTGIGNNQYYRSFVFGGNVNAFRRIIDGSILGSMVMGNKYVELTITNFSNKLSNSNIANANIAKEARGQSTIQPPSGSLNEFLDSYYVDISTLNGTSRSAISNTAGAIPQHTFSFNLIEHVQRVYGTIPGASTAEKVSWLKSNISKLTFNWYGSGSSPAGSKATIQRWRADNSSWYTPLSNTSTTPTKIAVTGNSIDVGINIDTSGFVHFIAYAEPSDGTTAAILNTDYAELQVEINTDIRSNIPLATPTSDGSMSKSDKSALDGAQKAKLTLDNGRSGQKNATDLNNEKVNSFFYVGTDALNRPDGVAGGWIQVESVNDLYVTQTFRSTLNGTTSQSMHLRVCHNGVWQPWKKILDFPSLGNLLMGNKLVDSTPLNFMGKVTGSVVANPHKALRGAPTGYYNPNTALPALTEFTNNNEYINITTLEGTTTSSGGSSTANGAIGQQVFSYNIVEHVQRTYGTIPGATLSDKISWLKVNLSKLTFNWFGFGQGVGGSKAYATVWYHQYQAYESSKQSHTNSTPTKLTVPVVTTAGIGAVIDANGFVHFIAHSEASDTTIATVLSTDYVELIVELSVDLGSSAKPQWVNATLQNSWVEYDSTQVPKFTIGKDGFVDLVGAVKSGVLGQTVFTLPAGYRPNKMIVAMGIGAPGNHYRVIISTSGAITIDQSVGTNGNAAVYLDNIRFPTL